MPAFPLLDRAGDAVLFRSRDGVRTAADFLADVAALAASLPDAPWLVNCCEDRYWFAVVLAAGLLREQPNLLTSERSPARLAALGRRYPGAVSVADVDGLDSPLRHRRVGIADLVGKSREGCNPDIPSDRIAALVFTSGTTGEPAASVKPWGALVERTRAAGLRFNLSEERPATIVGTVPPQHMYGLETTLLLPLHAAASSWVETVFYPEDARLALAASGAPRILVTTPLQLRAFMASGLPDAPEMVVSATAPLDPDLAGAAEQAWSTEVHEIFGATEVGSIASRRTVRDLDWHIYPGLSVERSEGAPCVRAPFLEPCKLSDTIEILEGQRFRLIGRNNDLLKLGGRRASHAGLNHILARIDGVEDGVFVVPGDLDRRSSARLTALVVAPNRTAQEILAGLRERIDAVFLPRRVIHVPSLPRNEIGKLTSEALHTLMESVAHE